MLLRQALDVLDDIDEREAAMLLQRTIDELTGAMPPQSIAEVEAVLRSPEGQLLLARIRSASPCLPRPDPCAHDRKK